MSNSVNHRTAYGKNQPLIDVYNAPIVSLRSPGVNDKADLGQLWVNRTTNAVWMLTSFVGGNAIWTELDNSGAGGPGLTWSIEPAAAVTMANNHGYRNGNAGATTFTMPLVSPLGSIFQIAGLGAGGWILQAAAGQNFTFGQIVGAAAGTLRPPANHIYAAVTLVTTVANTTFDVVATNDNLLLNV